MIAVQLVIAACREQLQASIQCSLDIFLSDFEKRSSTSRTYGFFSRVEEQQNGPDGKSLSTRFRHTFFREKVYDLVAPLSRTGSSCEFR